MTTLINEYQFSANTQLRIQIRNAEYDRSYWAKSPSLTTPPNASGVVGGNPTRASNYKTTTVQSDLNTKFEAFGMKHEALLGFEYLRENSYRSTLQNYGNTAAPVFTLISHRLQPRPTDLAASRKRFMSRTRLNLFPSGS